MRVLALALRAGAVLTLLGFAIAAVVDGVPRAIPVPTPVSATQPGKPATTPPVKRPPPSGLVTIAATGDIVMGSTPNLPPDGGRTFFSGVQADLAGDVVLGNLEGTLSVGGSSKCRAGSTNCYAFQTPPAYARWLAQARFTVLNVANNHAYDFGAAGQRQTLAALDRAGLLWTGRPGQITIQRVGQIRVAILGFASYRWAASLTNVPAAARLVRQAARRADVVVVTMHGGAEGVERQRVARGVEKYLGENRGDLVRFTHAVVDAGADLVVGHGPHVLRGMEWYKGRLIAYSLGNFAGYKVFSLGGPLSISAILRVTIRGDGTFETGTLVPTRLVRDGVPAIDPSESALGLVRTLSRQDFGARAVKIASTGVLSR